MGTPLVVRLIALNRLLAGVDASGAEMARNVFGSALYRFDNGTRKRIEANVENEMAGKSAVCLKWWAILDSNQ